jgi:pimeloyl-ACP methyl ester carboxylesterase
MQRRYYADIVHTLIYIHGLGDDNTVWQSLRQQPSVADQEDDTYVIPGFGNRAWNGERLEDAAIDLRTYISNIAKTVVLVGHSLGGAIGTVLAESPPQNLRGFINIEGNLTPADCNISGAAARSRNFDRWFELFEQKVKPRYAQALERCDRRAFQAMAEDLVRVSDDLGERYLALDLPKLVIYGTDGYAIETQEWVRSHVADALCVDGAGHWVQEDAPQETASAIQGFLERLG